MDRTEWYCRVLADAAAAPPTRLKTPAAVRALTTDLKLLCMEHLRSAWRLTATCEPAIGTRAHLKRAPSLRRHTPYRRTARALANWTRSPRWPPGRRTTRRPGRQRRPVFPACSLTPIRSGRRGRHGRGRG